MAEIHTGATITPSKLDLLTSWMGSQRWYAAKGVTPRLTRLFAWRLDDPDGEVGVETLVLLDEAGPEPVVYQVPLTYRGAPLASADHALVGTVEHSVLGRRWVYDAPHDPVYAALLLALAQGAVRASSSTATDAWEGSIVGGGPPDGSADDAVRPLVATSSRVLSGEQSNTSIIIDCTSSAAGGRPVIAKVFRMLASGENPDVVLQSALRRSGCDRVPEVIGWVAGHWPDPRVGGPGGGGESAAYGHLAFVQEFLPGAPDAWRVALRAIEERVDFTAAAHGLGVATAEVHANLAAALSTSPTGPREIDAILAGMRDRYAAATEEVPGLSDFAEEVEEVLAAAAAGDWPPAQRVHGDYHLGQVLHSPERGWILLDFEGEPLRPLAERTVPDQWIRDVAGMLRSFDYVGGSWEQAQSGSARAWVRRTQDAFLDGYAAHAALDPRSLPALLTAFELDKAMYEVLYEARNRPGWLGIPLSAVDRLTSAFRASRGRLDAGSVGSTPAASAPPTQPRSTPSALPPRPPEESS